MHQSGGVEINIKSLGPFKYAHATGFWVPKYIYKLPFELAIYKGGKGDGQRMQCILWPNFKWT